MFALKLLGGASIEGDAGPLAGPAAQRHRLALLALLATSRHEGVGRDKLIAYLWPESDAERARSSLKQAVHAIRRALGHDAILSAGDELRLNPGVVAADVSAFATAVAGGDPAGAVALYSGPFLDGFFMSAAPEFERWADAERERLRSSYLAMLEALAESAESDGDLPRASLWWRRLAAEAPGNSRVALRLMRALAASGDRAGAIRHAQVHTALLREEFAAEPDPEVPALLDRLRRDAASPSNGAAAPRHPRAPSPREPDSPLAVEQRDAPPKPGDPASRSGLDPAPVGLHARRHRRWLALPGIGALAILTILAWTWGAGRDDAQPSLAVLPFVDLSGDPYASYFGDGMTEELIHTLSSVHGLRVIARTSAFQFKDQSIDVREVGRRLNVGLVLEGSIRTGGTRVRITAQLVSAEDGSHLWSEAYERDLDDALALQADIARSIASALRLRLTDDAVARHSEDREAYHLYLKGRHAANQGIPGGTRQAIAYFEQAIARDSGYALAWAGLANGHAWLVDVAAAPPDEVRSTARALALHALELDPALAEAHALLGWMYTEEWRWEEAREALERAIALDPDQPATNIYYTFYLDNMGRFEEALEAALRAQALDPLSPGVSYNVAGSYLHLGRFELAIAEARRIIELHPTLPAGYDALGWALVDAGRPAAAVAPLEKAVELGQGRWLALANLGRAYAGVGREADAHAVLARLERDWGRLGFGSFAMAAVHLALGEREQALERLEQVYRLRHAKLPHVRQWTAFEPLYGDPDFSRIVREAGYTPPAAPGTGAS